jgi:hypothetical protein
LKNLLFQPSHMLLVLASPLTVASCTFQMARPHYWPADHCRVLVWRGWNIRLNHQDYCLRDN